MNHYDTNLDKNEANHVPLTPLTFLKRATEIYPNYEAIVYEDRSYSFVLKTPPASVLLVNAAKIKNKKGSSTPNRVIVGSITKAQLDEIANIKLPDLNTTKLSSAMKIVEGTARNMGISIVD